MGQPHANAINSAPSATGRCRSKRQSATRRSRLFRRENGAGLTRYQSKLVGCSSAFTKQRVPGTGVGSHWLQRIGVRHGGRVWADSRPDEGATFTLLCQEHVDETFENSGDPLVEDSARDAEITMAALKKGGLATSCVGQGRRRRSTTFSNGESASATRASRVSCCCLKSRG